MPEYPWYEVVESSAPLEQGDFLSSCPVFIPTSDPESIQAGAEIEVKVNQYEVTLVSDRF